MSDSVAAIDLSGRVVLVTGGSRGLGREIVLGMAHAGADVVIASRKLASCQATADQVVRATGRRALPVACHVGRWDELDMLVEAAYDGFGRVDVLVNNAGMAPLYDSLDTVSEQLWDKVQAVNLRAPFRLTSLIAPKMVALHGGSVINIGAIGSLYADTAAVPYLAAKAGLNALTVSMAHAYGPKVRVNCILPGMFRTDIAHSWDADLIAQRAQRLALARLGEPAEIVGTALYLASDLSSYTTGALINVSGGFNG